MYEAKNRTKKTWAITKDSNTGERDKIPNKLNICQPGQFSFDFDNPALVAEHLYTFFASVGERTSISIPTLPDLDPLDYMQNLHNEQSIFLLSTDTDEVIKTSMSIKLKSSTGVDGFSNKLIKHIILYVANPLAHTFNQSIATGTVAELYKIAKGIPIFKTGDKQNTSN